MPDSSVDAYPPPGDVWRDWTVGMRVVVRYRTYSEPPLTDALGYLVALDDAALAIETKRGVVNITLSDVVAGKPVPPPPRPRRSTPHP